MAVSSTTTKVTYTGNGTTDTYAYGFKIFEDSDLQLTETIIATGATNVLTLTTDYTVTGAGEEAGGTIVLVAGNLPATKKLTILRNLPLTQEVDLEENDNFLEQNMEDALDRLTMQNQTQQDEIDRSIKAAVTETTALTLPEASDGKCLKWSSGALINSTNDPDTQTDAAAASASAAASSASSASTSASNASTSETNASASADAAAASASSINLPSSPSDGDMLVYRTDEYEAISEGTSGQVLTSNGTGSNPTWQTQTGTIVQIVNTQTGTVATGTTSMPDDDTIPQNTEGDEYMTLAITPSNASNELKIDVVWNGANTNADSIGVALFQDSTAAALAGVLDLAGVNYRQNLSFTHYMTAGTTSETTFKVRAGGNVGATTTFNGAAGNQKLGGVAASSITITEITV